MNAINAPVKSHRADSLSRQRNDEVADQDGDAESGQAHQAKRELQEPGRRDSLPDGEAGVKLEQERDGRDAGQNEHGESKSRRPQDQYRECDYENQRLPGRRAMARGAPIVKNYPRWIHSPNGASR